MRRLEVVPRPDWRSRLEGLGMDLGASALSPYWCEAAAYEITSDEAETLYAATLEIERLVGAAVAHVVKRGQFNALGISEALGELAVRSWQRGEPSLYGRYDLRFDGSGPPKLLEYNADTPTALFEAAVVQWHWLQDCFPAADQYNSIHEELLRSWQRRLCGRDGLVHLACIYDDDDDLLTTAYLQDLAGQAGAQTQLLEVDDIGWDGRRFLDLERRPIQTLFKLYPWEWLAAEPFFGHLAASRTEVIEPAWRIIAASKGLLAVLWELFPGHPNLLPASMDARDLDGPLVFKPVLGREGANVQIEQLGRRLLREGPYVDMPRVAQVFSPLPEYDGWHPVAGAWVANGIPCGIGFREDRHLITGRGARFVPHLLRG